MSEAPIIIAGIPILFHHPALLAVLGIHVLAGLAAVVTGIAAMSSKKGPGRHPDSGRMYYWSLSVAFVTMSVLAASRWAEAYYLALLGLLAFCAASVGRTAIRKQWRFRVQAHISGMGLSYTLMLVAFYMDNGRNLPLWRTLPPATYWMLPGALGTALTIYAVFRYSGPIEKRRSQLRN